MEESPLRCDGYFGCMGDNWLVKKIYWYDGMFKGTKGIVRPRK